MERAARVGGEAPKNRGVLTDCEGKEGGNRTG